MTSTYNRERLILEIGIMLQLNISKERVHVDMDDCLRQVSFRFLFRKLCRFRKKRKPVWDLRGGVLKWLTIRSTLASTRAKLIQHMMEPIAHN